MDALQINTCLAILMDVMGMQGGGYDQHGWVTAVNSWLVILLSSFTSIRWNTNSAKVLKSFTWCR